MDTPLGTLLMLGGAVVGGLVLGLILRPGSLRFKETVESYGSLSELGQAVDQLPSGSIKRVQLVMIELMIVIDELRGLPPRRPGDYLPQLYGWTQQRSQAHTWKTMAIISAAGSAGLTALDLIFLRRSDALASVFVGVFVIFMAGMSLWFVSLARGPIARLWRQFEVARQANLPQRVDELRSIARALQDSDAERRTNRTSAST